MEIVMVKTDTLQSSPLNPRKNFDEVKTKELANSIKEKGIINALLVRHSGKKLEIICGDRRFRAAQLVGLKSIPVVINDLDDKQALEFMVIENLQREDVHPLEEAEGYKALMKEHGYKTVDDIAVKIGKSRTHVYDRLKLCDLIEDNRKLFCDNKLSPSVALLVARIPAHLQKEAGKKIAGLEPGANGEPMSYRRAMEFIANEYMLRLKEAKFDTDDAMLIDSNGSCTMCAKRTGNQKELFPDVTSADVCTDPVCFKAKQAAGTQKALFKAKESGKLILSDRDAKKVFFSVDSSSLGEGYLNLDSVCSEDKLGRRYKQLVKNVKDAKIVVGINPHSGDLVAMITRQEAARIRKQLGIVALKEEKGNKTSDKTQKPDDRIKEEQQKQVYEKVNAKIVEDVMDRVRKDKEMVFMRAMGEGMLESYSTQHTAFMFMKQRKPDVTRGNAVHLLEAYLDKISNSEILGFCLELMIYEGTEFGQRSELLDKLCKVYNVDIAAIKKVAAVKEVRIPKTETKAPSTETKTASQEAPAAEDEEAHVQMRNGNEFEYGGKNGKKVVVKSKGKLSFDQQKAAGKSLKKLTDVLSGDK